MYFLTKIKFFVAKTIINYNGWLQFKVIIYFIYKSQAKEKKSF